MLNQLSHPCAVIDLRASVRYDKVLMPNSDSFTTIKSFDNGSQILVVSVPTDTSSQLLETIIPSFTFKPVDAMQLPTSKQTFNLLSFSDGCE